MIVFPADTSSSNSSRICCPDSPAANLRQCIIRQTADVLAAKDVLAARRLIEAAEDVHERALSAAAGAHDGGVFAFDQLQVDRSQRGHFNIGSGLAIDLAEV